MITTRQPTLYLVRHGETAANRPDQEVVRGWSNVPLDPNGLRDLQKLASQFSQTPIHYVVASDLDRAAQTGKAIADATGAQFVTSPSLRPWNTGILTGRPKHDVQPDIIHYMTHPNETVPGGESYGDFYARNHDAHSKLMNASLQYPDENIVAVSHSRNLAAMPSIITGGRAPIVPGGGPPPGSISKLTFDGTNWNMSDGL